MKLILIIFPFLIVTIINGLPAEEGGFSSSTTTEEISTWDKIKQGVEHGWNVVYDEGHCAFHKVKGLVSSHNHSEGTDPCANKPYQKTTTTTPKSLVLVAEDEAVPVPSAFN